MSEPLSAEREAQLTQFAQRVSAQRTPEDGVGIPEAFLLMRQQRDALAETLETIRIQELEEEDGMVLPTICPLCKVLVSIEPLLARIRSAAPEVTR